MRAVSVLAFQVIDFLVYLFVVFNQLTRRRLTTIWYLLVISESAKSAAQVFRVLVRLRAHASELRARDYTTFNPFEPLPFSVRPDTRFRVTFSPLQGRAAQGFSLCFTSQAPETPPG